jgi:hypothetical protein
MLEGMAAMAPQEVALTLPVKLTVVRTAPELR